ncbi:MAG: DUF1254 domain-containing protein [Deltaproteobacteria bacterium]|nr:DUF1254 domain-containing protein [Deltaproteobacteria bacterium]
MPNCPYCQTPYNPGQLKCNVCGYQLLTSPKKDKTPILEGTIDWFKVVIAGLGIVVIVTASVYAIISATRTATGPQVEGPGLTQAGGAANLNQAQALEAEALRLGVEAYIYGYPLVTMEITRRVMTNAVKPDARCAPMGQFATMRAFADASFREITAPNADTLNSIAWLNLDQEPYVLSLPEARNRYYLIPLLDAWTNVFQILGPRTTGTKAQVYAITGPNWKGALPAGIQEIKSPTNLVWILGRTYCTGTAEDFQKVHALQEQYRLVPLSAYGKPYTPPQGKVNPAIDMKTPVREQVNRLDAETYFKLLAALIKDNPPAAEDAPLVDKMAKMGLLPSQEFDLTKMNPAVAKGLKSVPFVAQEKIRTERQKLGPLANGWQFSTKLGVYGTDYLLRALTTWIRLGANRGQDAIYAISEEDPDGKPYDGYQRYVLHFDKGQLPPVKAFWSLTLYDSQFFLAVNPLNRYALGSRHKFNYNQDGSLDLFIQNESPGKSKEANWLPAPKEKFVLCLRLYWPEEPPHHSVFDGSWKAPAAKRATH